MAKPPLKFEEAPLEIRNELRKIVNRIATRNLDVFSELAKAVTIKQVRGQTKLGAFWLLGQIGGRKGCQLLKKIAKDKNANIEDRSKAVWALSKLSYGSVTSVLEMIFKNEDDQGLIWEAAKGLTVRRKGIPYSHSLLVTCLKKSRNPVRREAAAWCLGWIGNKRNADSLLSTLKNRKELPPIRGQAAESLGMLQYKKGLHELIKALNDPSVEVRFWAAFALGDIGDTKAVPHLRHLARTDKRKLPGWWSVAKEAKDAITSIEMPACNVEFARKIK